MFAGGRASTAVWRKPLAHSRSSNGPFGGTWSPVIAGHERNPDWTSASVTSGRADRFGTPTWTSMRSFAARPGTAVEPMWSMRAASGPSAARSSPATASNAAGQPSRYGMISIMATAWTPNGPGRVTGAVGEAPGRRSGAFGSGGSGSGLDVGQPELLLELLHRPEAHDAHRLG